MSSGALGPLPMCSPLDTKVPIGPQDGDTYDPSAIRQTVLDVGNGGSRSEEHLGPSYSWTNTRWAPALCQTYSERWGDAGKETGGPPCPQEPDTSTREAGDTETNKTACPMPSTVMGIETKEKRRKGRCRRGVSWWGSVSESQENPYEAHRARDCSASSSSPAEASARSSPLRQGWQTASKGPRGKSFQPVGHAACQSAAL